MRKLLSITVLCLLLVGCGNKKGDDTSKPAGSYPEAKPHLDAIKENCGIENYNLDNLVLDRTGAPIVYRDRNGLLFVDSQRQLVKKVEVRDKVEWLDPEGKTTGRGRVNRSRLSVVLSRYGDMSAVLSDNCSGTGENCFADPRTSIDELRVYDKRGELLLFQKLGSQYVRDVILFNDNKHYVVIYQRGREGRAARLSFRRVSGEIISDYYSKRDDTCYLTQASVSEDNRLLIAGRYLVTGCGSEDPVKEPVSLVFDCNGALLSGSE